MLRLVDKVRRVVDFLKRTRTEYLKEFMSDEVKDYNRTRKLGHWSNDVASDLVECSFEVEHHPEEGIYIPVVIKSTEKDERVYLGKSIFGSHRNTTVVVKHVQRYYIFQQLSENKSDNPTFRQNRLLSSSDIYDTDGERCLTRNSALKLIAIYKERYLQSGVTKEIVK